MTTIMVVEEDRLLRTAIAAYLKMRGYTVREAPNAALALEGLTQEPVSAVLLDTEPAARGLALLKQIRQQPMLAQTPIIAIVATNGGAEALDYLEPGDYVRAPFDMPYLDWTIKKVLARQAELAGA